VLLHHKIEAHMQLIDIIISITTLYSLCPKGHRVGWASRREPKKHWVQTNW